MPDEKYDSGKDEKHFKMLKSAELAEMVEGFHADLQAGRSIGWDRFIRAIRWLNDPDKIRGWTRVFQLCHQRSGETRMVRGVPVTFSMLPWENPRIWQPFIVDIYSDLNAKFKEEGDILSIVAFSVGRPRYETTTATGLFDFIRAKGGTKTKEKEEKRKE